MSKIELADSELARLEELEREGAGSYDDRVFSRAEVDYVIAACDAMPSLVAEVRRLRAAVQDIGTK